MSGTTFKWKVCLWIDVNSLCLLLKPQMETDNIFTLTMLICTFLHTVFVFANLVLTLRKRFKMFKQNCIIQSDLPLTFMPTLTNNNLLEQLVFRPGDHFQSSLTLRMGSPSDTVSAIALAPSGRTRQSPKLITWMLRRCFSAWNNKTTFCCSHKKKHELTVGAGTTHCDAQLFALLHKTYF